mmetsp:Transcript_9456/g.15307  ORF Transcript_9456/g.15307 Transcript_9456/m.15307 type:complete len:322 (-) Transcript_9456:100-1065(-)
MARIRFSEPPKFLPVAFSFCTILGLYLIYVLYHCIPMLQFQVPPSYVDLDRRQRGLVELVVFHILTGLLLVCYFQSILQDPGEIPDNDPNWTYNNVASHQEDRAFERLNMQESKKGGGRRHCKWCGKYKPDRCHHCRVCRSCILKMDHHCPWIYNCVGHNNYKYFYLLLFYCVLDLHLIMWTMVESVVRSWDTDTPFVNLFFVLFGESLSVFLGVLLTVFFGFHNWLMLRAMTTIEFCEKKMPKEKDTDANKSYGDSVYDLGCLANVQAVLGKNPLTWPVPISPHEPWQNGLSFVTADSRLSKDFDGNRGRIRGHQKIPRK